MRGRRRFKGRARHEALDEQQAQDVPSGAHVSKYQVLLDRT